MTYAVAKKVAARYTRCKSSSAFDLYKEEHMEQEYYFITVFRRADIDNLGWPDTGDRRTWGFLSGKGNGNPGVA